MASNKQQRSMDEIESDLDTNRDHLSDTLEALERQLAPGDMVERAKAYIRDSGSQEFVDNLRVSVTRNPIPLTLVGAGVTWLMMSGASQSQSQGSGWTQRLKTKRSGASSGTSHDSDSQGSSRTGSAASSARQGMGRAAQRSRAGMQSVGGGAKKGMQSVSGGARRGASSVGSAGRQGAARTKNGFDYMLREEPIASGLIGLAVGALVAASLPRTRREDELMGEQRDQFVDGAQSSGKQQADKARQVAEAALDAGSEAASSEAERQGFSRPASGGPDRPG